MGVKKNYVKGPSPRNRRKLDKNIRTQVTGSSVKKVNQFFFGQTLWMEVVLCSRCDEFSRNVQ